MTVTEITPAVHVRPSMSAFAWIKSDGLALATILVAGLLARVLLLWQFQQVGLGVHDERDYDQLATSLAVRGEFGYAPGQLSSLRPPLYPSIVSGIYQVAGLHNFQAVRAFQIVLALLTVVIVYALARRLYDGRIALMSATAVCFYPSLLGAGNLVLTETLFTLLVCSFVLVYSQFVSTRKLRWILLAGLILGLGALTRSVLWLFPPLVLATLLLLGRGQPWRWRALACGLFIAAFGLTLLPWTVRNTRLQRTFTTVDVMGGRNVMMGNYEHTPAYRPWAAVEIEGEQAWHQVLSKRQGGFQGKSQGQIDKLALKYAVSYVIAHPIQTLQRSVAKFFHFWQLEREIIAGLHEGIWGPVSKGALLVTALVILSAYVVTISSGIMGIWLTPPSDRATHVLMLLLIVFVTAIHSLAFAHSRYHLPLMPFIMIYASAAWSHRVKLISQWRSPAFVAASLTVMVLSVSWVVDLVFESGRL